MAVKGTPDQRQSYLLQVVTQWKSLTSSTWGEGLHGGPVERGGFINEAVERERPIGERNFGLHAEVEDGEAGGQLLPGREAAFGAVGAGAHAGGDLFFGPLLFGGDVALFGHGGKRGRAARRARQGLWRPRQGRWRA